MERQRGDPSHVAKLKPKLTKTIHGKLFGDKTIRAYPVVSQDHYR